MKPQNETPPPLPGLSLVFVEGGEFLMGDEKGDLWEACRPAHPVSVSSFYLNKHLVTQALWQSVMNNNPSGFKGENRPVEQVSWNDAQDFLKKLNARQDVQAYLRQLNPPGLAFRLPTEAEWEYAARGGKYSQGFTYSGSDKLKQVGWYNENSDNETHEVGLLLANELGIYDMSGNVYEWCEDWFDEKYYDKCKKKGLAENPKGPEQGVLRVLRGGSVFNEALGCRPSYRFRDRPVNRFGLIGFRLCLSLQSVG